MTNFGYNDRSVMRLDALSSQSGAMALSKPSVF